MSHVVTIRTMVRDRAAVDAACRRLRWALPRMGEASLYSGEVSGLVVTVPDWVYPVVADLASGQLRYDNFGGAWGDVRQLDRFLQAYAVEKTRIEARRQGHDVVEQPLPDGSIRMTIRVGGGS